MKGTVELSNAQLNKAGMVVNPYVFMTSITSNAICDLGLLYIDDPSYTTGWYLFRNPTSGELDLGGNTPLLVTPASSPKDVELTYTYATGVVALSAKNLFTGVNKSISHTSNIYDSSQTYVGLAAITSFVPEVTYTTGTPSLRRVSDIKSGAYFKNVVWSDISVSTTANGVHYNITPLSPQLKTIVVYDTDSTSYSYLGNTSTTDIWYDPTYQ